MLFSTRAEYGVRLMVELGRQEDGSPVALSAVAESERLPLSYLEHLVAKLRQAGLVESQRGVATTSNQPQESNWQSSRSATCT